MTAESKSPFDQVNDVVKQLKEMHHYSKNNVERLTSQWLLFEGELKTLGQTEPIEELMTRQGELHEAIATEIELLEALAQQLEPKEDEGESPTQH